MASVLCDIAIEGLERHLAQRSIMCAPSTGGDAEDAAIRLVDGRSCGAVDCLARVRGEGWNGPIVIVVDDANGVVAALDAGAHDAVDAAAPVEEIAARIAACIRTGSIRLGELAIDPMRGVVTGRGRDLRLLPREFALIHHLACNAGRTIAREELLRVVWRLDFDPGTNVVAVHVSRLRARLAAAGLAMLHTDRGRGYRLAA